jgi:sodium/bile acid cotransporter 7
MARLHHRHEGPEQSYVEHGPISFVYIITVSLFIRIANFREKSEIVKRWQFTEEERFMAYPSLLARLKVDPYIVAILGMIALASVVPSRGSAAVAMDHVTNGAIALLFFLYGGRLSSEAVMAGVGHWRLQLVVFVSTFVLFPVLGLAIGTLVRPLLPPELSLGLIFLGMLPSTVQSSIAFTSIARGNVPAAVCCASLSNLLGIVVTPLLVGAVLSAHGQGFSLDAVGDITVQLFLPFLAGQVLRRWIGGWLERNRRVLGYVDRGSILLVVYTAFSEGVEHGIWHQLDWGNLALLLLADMVLLAAVLATTRFLSRQLGFNKADEIAIVFCGSKKSLASGIPMANILFAGTSVGLMVLPLMLFHQLQLMACAVLARRYAARAQAKTELAPGAALVAYQG